MVLHVHSSMYNQNLFPARTKNRHNSTTGKKAPQAHAKREQVPPAHAKRVYLLLYVTFDCAGIAAFRKHRWNAHVQAY
jgi:hypothetical protein